MKVSSFLIAGALSLAALNVAAGTVTLSDATGVYNGTDGTGGAFVITSVSGFNGVTGGPGVAGNPNSFLSFCLERSEFINLPGGPYTTTIDTGAIMGGLSGGNPDPISEATALLYSSFRNSAAIAVAGLGDGLVNTSAETTALQYAIWQLEGEGAGLPANTLATDLINWAQGLAPVGSNNFYNVRVLNLYNSNGSAAQSQLTLVPLPTAAWMGLGLFASAAGVSYARRRAVLA